MSMMKVKSLSILTVVDLRCSVDIEHKRKDRHVSTTAPLVAIPSYLVGHSS